MRHRAMTWNRAIRTFTFLAVIALSPQLFASSKPIAAGEARYVIVLAPGAHTPDIAALGGRVEASTWQSLTIVIPVSAEPALRASSAIRSITPVVTGSSERMPAETAPTRNSQPRQDHARDASMSTTIWGSGQYTYDGAGNITAMGIASVLPNSDGKVSTFTYDLASRLTNATMGRAAGDRVESYTYDGFGNLTQRTLNATPGSYNPAPDPTNNQMTETGTHYDEAGNLDNWATMASFTYDAVNQVTSLTPNLPGTPPSSYIYDVNDERVAVQSGGATQWTIRSLNNKPIRQFSSGLLTDSTWSGSAWLWTEDFVWNGNTLVAGGRPPATGGPRNFHVDHLGSIRVVTDGTGFVVSSDDFAPFGEALLTAGVDEGPLKFTGHERDGNFDYMHARYYDWRRGRFLSVDPVLDIKGALQNPQVWNRYEYVQNNPINKIDPNGRYEEDVHFGLTEVLASSAGFDAEAAGRIARADQSIDEFPNTQPFASQWARENFHFTTQATRDALWSSFESFAANGATEPALVVLGQFMHTQQDSYSHAGFGPGLGHVLAGHAPDKTYTDPAKALRMAHDTYNKLSAAADKMGVPRSNRVAWNAIRGSIVNFNLAHSKKEKDKYLQQIRDTIAAARSK
jgi:RHS repeat-associated protein